MDAQTYESMLTWYRRGCVFCDPHPGLVLHGTENFQVCFDVAPLVPGHLIVFSRGHHACAGEVPVEHFAELEAARTEVKRRIREAWGRVTLYEHGRAGHCLADGPEHRLCHHFHLHCVPGDADIGDELVDRFERIPMTSYRELPEIYAEYGDYLYLETDAGEMSYLVVNEEIERHLLRTLIAKRGGFPERADWREYADRSILLEGMTTLLKGTTTPGAVSPQGSR